MLDQEDRRTVTYAKLDLMGEEENIMLAWGLTPRRSNEGWWAHYRNVKDAFHTVATKTDLKAGTTSKSEPGTDVP